MFKKETDVCTYDTSNIQIFICTTQSVEEPKSM